MSKIRISIVIDEKEYYSDLQYHIKGLETAVIEWTETIEAKEK